MGAVHAAEPTPPRRGVVFAFVGIVTLVVVGTGAVATGAAPSFVHRVPSFEAFFGVGPGPVPTGEGTAIEQESSTAGGTAATVVDITDPTETTDPVTSGPVAGSVDVAAPPDPGGQWRPPGSTVDRPVPGSSTAMAATPSHVPSPDDPAGSDEVRPDDPDAGWTIHEDGQVDEGDEDPGEG